MLVLGLILRCLDPVLTTVASLSSRPLFVSPLEKREAATQYDIVRVLIRTLADTFILRARLRFDKHNSDLLTDVHAYNECIRLRSDESRGTFRHFCEEVSARSLVDTNTKKTDILTEFHLDERRSRDHFAPSRVLFLAFSYGISSHVFHAKLPEP